MRRTAVLAALLAALVLAPAVPAVAAGDLHVLSRDGTERVVHDPALPPPDPVMPGPLGDLSAPRMTLEAPVARAAATKTVKGELRRLQRAGDLDDERYRDAVQTWNRAQASLKDLRGAGRREQELGSILRVVEQLAAGGGLTAGRVPVLT